MLVFFFPQLPTRVATASSRCLPTSPTWRPSRDSRTTSRTPRTQVRNSKRWCNAHNPLCQKERETCDNFTAIFFRTRREILEDIGNRNLVVYSISVVLDTRLDQTRLGVDTRYALLNYESSAPCLTSVCPSVTSEQHRRSGHPVPEFSVPGAAGR